MKKNENKNIKFITIAIILILILTFGIIYLVNSRKEEVSIDKFLDEMTICTKIELYQKNNDSHSSYKKVKDITDKKIIEEIIELFRSSKENQNSKNMNLYFRGHLIKFLKDNDVIVEYNEEKLSNKHEYLEYDLNNESRYKLYEYYNWLKSINKIIKTNKKIAKFQ